MRRPARLPLLAVLLAATLLLGGRFVDLGFAEENDVEPQVEAAPAPADEEPPMEYALELDGRSVDLLLDRETTLDLPGGQTVKAKLTAKPERLFRAGGVSFRYPRQHAFEVERDGDTVTWTFDGNDNVLILTRHAAVELEPEQLRNAVVAGLVSQYGPENCKTSDASVSLGGSKHAATRVAASLAGARLVQDVVAWKSDAKVGNGEAAVYVLIVQDSPPDEAGDGAADATSGETKRVLKLLDETFKPEPN